MVIICAGVRQQKNETRLDLTKRNADILKTIIPPLLSFSPNAVFIIASNPGYYEFDLIVNSDLREIKQKGHNFLFLGLQSIFFHM